MIGDSIRLLDEAAALPPDIGLQTIVERCRQPGAALSRRERPQDRADLAMCVWPRVAAALGLPCVGLGSEPPCALTHRASGSLRSLRQRGSGNGN